MIEALFERERAAEPLETPEQRTAFKSRLRAAAASIADPDLAAAYADALLERHDALFAAARGRAAPPRPSPWPGAWRDVRAAAWPAHRPRAKAAAAPAAPRHRAVAAATLARRAIERPGGAG